MDHDTAIPMDRSELAVIDAAVELVADRPYASTDPLAPEAVILSKQLHIRAGAAGTEALFPLREEELAALERIREELRLPGRIPEHPAARVLPEFTTLLRRLYERIGAATVINAGGVDVIANQP